MTGATVVLGGVAFDVSALVAVGSAFLVTGLAALVVRQRFRVGKAITQA